MESLHEAQPAGRNFARFSAQLAPGKWVAPNADRDRRRNEANACRKSPACLASCGLVARRRVRRPSRNRQEAGEGRRRQAGAGRELRRLERLPEPGRKVSHLLYLAQPKERATGRSEARSRLRLHFRAARRGRAQRGLASSWASRSSRRAGRRSEGQEKGGREGQEIEERSDLSDRGRSAMRSSNSCPRATTSG